MNKNDFSMEIKKALRRKRQQRGDFRSDEEIREAIEKLYYYTEEEARDRIQRLENGPETYTIEDETSETGLRCITRAELIEDVKQRIRKTNMNTTQSVKKQSKGCG